MHDKVITPAFFTPTSNMPEELDDSYNRTTTGKLFKTGIPELDELLFPNKDTKGFEEPSDNNTVPRVVLIKGEPGTGKTSFAVQILSNMASNGIKCTYFTTHDFPQSIEYIVSEAFKFQKYQHEQIPKFQILENWKDIDLNKIKIIPVTNMFSERAIVNYGGGFEDFTENLYHDFFRPKHLNYNDVVFIDSLNLSNLGLKERSTIDYIFSKLKKSKNLCFVLLEDYGMSGTDQTRQLIADCEFMSDIVIDLELDHKSDYELRWLRIAKKHFGPQGRGRHCFKICEPNHSLSNLFVRTGILIFPSLPMYLSGARNDTFLQSNEKFVQSGITHMDSFLSQENQISGKSMAPNSCIVIQGKRGSHKLAIGINILMGGLWRIDPNENVIKEGSDTLVILLNEDYNIELNKIATVINSQHTKGKDIIEALYSNGVKSLDNGAYIAWVKHHVEFNEDTFISICKNEPEMGKELYKYMVKNGHVDKIGTFNKPLPDDFEKVCNSNSWNYDSITKELRELYHGNQHKQKTNSGRDHYAMGCELEKLFGLGKNYKQKIIFNKWCAHINGTNSCRKVVIANFRPGHITPEEFLCCVKELMENKPFSRVLFQSTALIPIRFPLLAKEKLFIPSMIDLFKSQNVMSIIIDPISDEKEARYDLGLEHVADYLINLYPHEDTDKFKIMEHIDIPDGLADTTKANLKDNSNKDQWAFMKVNNNRNNNYSNVQHAVTVRRIVDPNDNKVFSNELFIIDMKGEPSTTTLSEPNPARF